MTKRLLLTFAAGIAFMASTLAQSNRISGTITDDIGDPLPGASIVVKGTTVGTSTDINGKFSLEYPDNAKAIIISALGFKKIEKLITSAPINLKLIPDAVGIDEVVVTANAIKREKRSLGYSTATIKSEELVQGGDRSVLNSMQGKVAGLNITNGGGGPNSSTRIVLRGGSSIQGNNQALIVIDGVPVDNSSFQNSDNLNNQVDAGNRANDLNPNDVESVNILKGPTATALYGSRAANGAVIITTKSGKGKKGAAGKGFQVNYNTSYSNENILKLPTFQNSFGQGGDGQPILIENWSWGDRFDGKTRPWGQEVNGMQRVKTYEGQRNNVKNFFNTGHTYNNNVSFSGNSEKSDYYFSVGNLNNTGVVPGTKFNRTTIKINNNFKLSKKLTSSANITYAKTKGFSSIQGQGDYSAYDNVLQTPRDIPLSELKDLNNPFNTNAGYYGAYTYNPYFLLANSGQDNFVDHVTGVGSLSYKPISWIDLTARVGNDFYTDSRNNFGLKFSPEGVSALNEVFGVYSENIFVVSDLTSDLIASFSPKISENVTFTGILGQNFRQRKASQTYASTSTLVVPDFYNLTNSANPVVVDNDLFKRRSSGVYVNGNFGFKNYLFIGASFRNDVSSTLPASNRNYSYYSADAAFVLTDAIKLESDVISFIKLRGSYGQVGNDASEYLTKSNLSTPTTIGDGFNNSEVRFPVNSVPSYTYVGQLGNENLKPEITTAYEFGTDVSFFNERFSIEATYYNKLSKNQILPIDISRSSGYSSKTINAGAIRNKGIELLVRATPIASTSGLRWEVFATYTRNRGIVEKLAPGLPQVAISGGGLNGMSVVAAEGELYGSFYGVTPKTTSDGKVIVDPNTGLPVLTSSSQLLGSYQAKYTASLGNTFKLGNISLTVLLDGRKGGKVYSRTKSIQDFVGTSITSVTNDRNPYVLENSVIEVKNGNGDVVGYEENTKALRPQDYWTGQTDPSRNLLDASFLKLREVNVTYTIPKKLIKRTPFEGAFVSFAGRNLWIRTAKSNTYIDPETSSFGTGNAQGFEFGSIPSLKTATVSLNLTF